MPSIYGKIALNKCKFLQNLFVFIFSKATIKELYDYLTKILGNI